MRGVAVICAVGALPVSAYGQSATRVLPDSYAPGQIVPVSVSIVVLPETGVMGLEDQPPADWSIANISDSGTWDENTGKVKWGLFFGPPFPTSVSYNATPPATGTGEQCFAGLALFDTVEQAVDGDLCVPIVVPAVTTWGFVVLALLTIIAATRVLSATRANRPDGSYG